MFPRPPRIVAWLLATSCGSPPHASEPSEKDSASVYATASHAATPAPDDAPRRHQGAHPSGHGFHLDFSDVERYAARFDEPSRDDWQRPAEVVALMRLTPGSTVADLGAGTGYFVGYLSDAVGAAGRVLALDVEPKMVEYIKRRYATRANVTARVVAPDDPGLEPRSADRILVVNTWHHLDDRARYGQQLLAALSPTGELWIIDFDEASDVGPPQSHRLSEADVVRELEAAGFAAAVIDETLPKQYAIRGLAPR